jgi:hypothetical protein
LRSATLEVRGELFSAAVIEFVGFVGLMGFIGL